ncbi:MAG: TIGR00266 family protein [Desulfosarcinaceae bacterium]|nr:TIGR00266 family protein [Desulfosarcinaceae bacterium]
MTQWYLSYDGNQTGPFDQAQAAAQAQQNPNGYAWRDGYAEWLPISQIEELAHMGGGVPAPPPMVRTSKADEIDFKIRGAEMQFVEVELDPGESAVAEAGAMMYKDATVHMTTVFGDGSAESGGGGFMDKLLGAGKRLLTGESLFMTVFTHNGQGKAHVAFGAPYPGNIIPVPLESVGGTLICQKDSFLCAAKGVSVGIHFQRKILTGLFGGEGFIMQRLDGDGLVFVHAGGTVIDRTLTAGETLHVDTGCIVAMESTVQFDIQQAGNIKTALFGGEGLFFANLQGPGRVWLQSLPFSRLAGRMLQAAPQRGGSQGEGSVLGALGGFIDGDNR